MDPDTSLPEAADAVAAERGFSGVVSVDRGDEVPAGTGRRDPADGVVRFAWQGSHCHGEVIEELWFAIGRDGGGDWWFDAHGIGRVRLAGGAPQAAELARWLLAAPAEDRCESEFVVVDGERRSGPSITWLPDGATEPVLIEDTLTVTLLRGRDDRGGPEYLQVIPRGDALSAGFSFQIRAELDWEPVDREALEAAAARLLTLATDQRR